MPAQSKAQQRFMAMCRTTAGRKKARGKCPSKAVAEKYSRAPAGKLAERAKGRALGS